MHDSSTAAVTKIFYLMFLCLFVIISDAFITSPCYSRMVCLNQVSSQWKSSELYAGKGFGSTPKKEKKRPTIIPKPEKSCPCCSGVPYKDCCQPYHERERNPPTAVALMRARYCAYACRFPDFILDTTHPINPEWTEDREAWKKGATAFSDEYKFLGLEVRDVEEISDTEAYVRFTSTFSAFGKKSKKELGVAGESFPFTEKSRFIKEDGVWYYVDGDITENFEGMDELLENEGVREYLEQDQKALEKLDQLRDQMQKNEGT
eukprot:CAMPEP_0117860238 /NCGR_PEP_ID=MMETSP0950-20121206/3649_1 /TAXON_ID=44440 /ORGANISM="Chattonella subsalsa, Strain CCMP2191" /LENGTH=261 /DNA_ID=CAMNT_0005710343 /DNA_START=30 /DNA_END=815 /DNA_ORIENTATION=+